METSLALYAAEAGMRLYLCFSFFYYNKFLVEKKGLGDYGAVTLVSKTERGQKFSITQECRGGGTLSKTEAVMPCQGNWVSQQPARMKSSVHGRR